MIVFIKREILGLFPVYFVISNKRYNFYNKYVKKCPSSMCCWDSNTQPSEHESLPITTCPGLSLVIIVIDCSLVFLRPVYWVQNGCLLGSSSRRRRRRCVERHTTKAKMILCGKSERATNCRFKKPVLLLWRTICLVRRSRHIPVQYFWPKFK